MTDVDGDGVVGFAVILVLPDFVKQFLRADHVPGVLQENTQDRKFRRCQHQRFFTQETGVGLDIHGQVTANNGVCRSGRGRFTTVGTSRIVPVIPAQLGFHPRHQFQRTKRLCHIVVGPQGQPSNFVRFLIFGRQHDNGPGVLFPYLLAQRKAVNFRHHHVQNGKVKFRGVDTRKGFRCRVELKHGIILADQIGFNQVGNFSFIIYN